MRILILVSLVLVACRGAIKNNNEPVVEPGTETTEVAENGPKELPKDSLTTKVEEVVAIEPEIDLSKCYGTYVGFFEPDMGEEVKTIYAGDVFHWDRSNKICICIEKIDSTQVSGYSIVAGNKRKFTGKVNVEENKFLVMAKEPGDDQYDGEFSFVLYSNNIQGTWQAFKKIEINKRKYNLDKKEFKYDPEVDVEYTRYVDWTKKIKKKVDYGENEIYYEDAFAAATNNVMTINASTTLLTKKDVENLKKGDLLVIRNAIYARHGYSFKNRPLRVYFDRQEWYMPISTNIKMDFTEIEKKNIELLLRYEKNALQHYDRFGRG